MRIGFIGTGAVAQRHLDALRRAAPPVEFVAHLSTALPKAEAAAARWGGRGYAQIDAFVRHGRPDAVLVTVPPAQHGAIEFRLIADRIPFLVEKPLSADAATAERIGERLSRRPLVTAAGYQWRAMDAMPDVRSFLAAHPPRMVIGEFHVGMPASAWWRRQSESGGQMVEQACHLVDLARHLLGEATVEAALAAPFPSKAFPDADIATASAALLRFPNGVPGLFSATCLSPHPKSVQLRVICDQALARVDLQGATFLEGENSRHLAVAENPYLTQDRAFLRAVESGRPQDVFCSYHDALATHRLCHVIAQFERPVAP